MRRVLHLLVASVVLASVANVRPIAAQSAIQAAAVDPKAAAAANAIDDKRKELGIPGASLAIVKDDKILLLQGFGLRDMARNLPATPDTLFAIGSSTKAFTAMAVAMAADDGKLSLDDSPKKFLPFFKL